MKPQQHNLYISITFYCFVLVLYTSYSQNVWYNNECIYFFLYTLYNENHILVDYRSFVWLLEGIYLTHTKMLQMLLLWSSIMVLFFFPITVRRPSVKPIITAQNKFTTPLWYMNMDNTAVYTFSQDGVQWKIIHKYICTFLRTIKIHVLNYLTYLS